MSLRDDLNQPVKWKYVLAVLVFYAGTVQEHWAWIFVSAPLAGAVLLYAGGSQLREIPAQLGALVLLGIFLSPLFLAINYPVETFSLLVGLGSLVVAAASR